MIGLSGSHGTGKTTLAQAYAKKRDFTCHSSSATPTFERLGIDPSARLGFADRLRVQSEILTDLDAGWSEYSGQENVITDRTPLDLMMYVLADVGIGSVAGEDVTGLKRYVERCFEIANKRFGAIIVVQPGIPLVEGREGKGAVDEMYIEHCNTLALGLIRDCRLQAHGYYMPRVVTDLETRMNAIDSCIEKSVRMTVSQRAEATLH